MRRTVDWKRYGTEERETMSANDGQEDWWDQECASLDHRPDNNNKRRKKGEKRE